MMSIRVRKNEERGKAKYDWLESYHTFSFDTYYDEKEMGFGELRVINEDIVQSGRGFGEHGHKNMEIIAQLFLPIDLHQFIMGDGLILRVCAICVLGMVSAGFLMD